MHLAGLYGFVDWIVLAVAGCVVAKDCSVFFAVADCVVAKDCSVFFAVAGCVVARGCSVFFAVAGPVVAWIVFCVGFCCCRLCICDLREQAVCPASAENTAREEDTAGGKGKATLTLLTSTCSE